MNEKIGVNNDLISKIKSEEELLAVFKIYLTIYGKNGISKIIMKNMIPLINQELYRLLVDSCHFILELNVNDKNEVEFIMIDTETRIVKPLNSGSGYERTISSLALRSVLTKISSLPKPNIVVMDEVFGKIADENPHLTLRHVERIVNTVFEEIIDALAKGDRVELRGFGAFSVKKREPRTGRNPRTGEQVAVASKRVPYFKTGKDLRERLNGGS